MYPSIVTKALLLKKISVQTREGLKKREREKRDKQELFISLDSYLGLKQNQKSGRYFKLKLTADRCIT